MRSDESKIEEMSADDARVAAMLAGLRRVKAPANFEFGLKAKLASAVPPKRRPASIPAFVRYSAPLAIMAVVGSLLYINSPESADVPAVQTAGVPAPVQKVIEPEPQPAVNGPAKLEIQPDARTVASVNTVRPIRREASVPASIVRTAPRPVSGQGSTVHTLGQPKIFLPRGIDPAAVPGNALPGATTPPLGASDVLPALGIDAGYGDSGWKVRSVKGNSPADRAGVKAGDVVEAIDDTMLGRNPAFKGVVNAQVVRVRRDGKVIELTIQNK